MLAVGRALMASPAADAGRAQPGPGAAHRARDLPHHRAPARDRRGYPAGRAECAPRCRWPTTAMCWKPAKSRCTVRPASWPAIPRSSRAISAWARAATSPRLIALKPRRRAVAAGASALEYSTTRKRSREQHVGAVAAVALEVARCARRATLTGLPLRHREGFIHLVEALDHHADRSITQAGRPWPSSTTSRRPAVGTGSCR